MFIAKLLLIICFKLLWFEHLNIFKSCTLDLRFFNYVAGFDQLEFPKPVDTN
jgi:hypothetical protein